MKHDEITNQQVPTTHDLAVSGRPVLVDQKEEHKIDFRLPGLSHAVVKKKQKIIVIEHHFMSTRSRKRLQPIYQKIETHDPGIG